MTEYRLIRSVRKTIAIVIERDGAVVVRAPHTAGRASIDRAVASRAEWIERKSAEMRERAETRRRLELTGEQIRQCKARAKERLTARCAHYAGIMGVRYKEIKITSAHTRWGSCTSRGTLTFAWRLALAPPELADYVVVHELAHLIELNHSKRFWHIVDLVMPDYKEREKKLREWQNGLEFV